MIKSTKSAVLIVDMQNGVVHDAYKKNDVVKNINTAIFAARAKAIPVIWVQHSSDELPMNSSQWKIIDELVPLTDETIIHKIHGDSFEGTNLKSLLENLGVKQIFVCGAQTEACIRSTIHGAFARDFNTYLIGDAHTTVDLTQYGLPTPQQLVEFTNAYWKWQTGPDKKAGVVSTQDIPSLI